MNNINITVIICTLGTKERENQLFRSIESILSQDHVCAKPLVVLNGNKYSKAVYRRLTNNKNITLLKTEVAGLKTSRILGRKNVDSDYFCFLDDDDEILPDALKTRLDPFLEDSTIDVVSTNGLRQDRGIKRKIHEKMPTHDDLAFSALTKIWLNSASALFKTASVPLSIHQQAPEMFEWTYIALKLSIDKKIILLNDITYIIHMGADQQMTNSIEYFRKEYISIDLMLCLPISKTALRTLKNKRHSTLHALAFWELQNGNYLKAWEFHLSSLTYKSFCEYILSTRHFFKPHNWKF